MARKPKQLSPEQSKIVGQVRRSARARTRANDAYIDAIVTARESGATFAAIAEAADVSSQAVQEIVRRHTRDDAASVTDLSALRRPQAASNEERTVAARSVGRV